MKRRTPWALITITVAVLGAVVGLVSSTDAFYSPLVYQYLAGPQDTFVVRSTALAAGGRDSVTFLRKVAGAAGGYGVDTLGIGDLAFVLAGTGDVSVYFFLNGKAAPAETVALPANGSASIPIRWIDSLYWSSATGTTPVVAILGHKQWFSGGGTY